MILADPYGSSRAEDQGGSIVRRQPQATASRRQLSKL